MFDYRADFMKNSWNLTSVLNYEKLIDWKKCEIRVQEASESSVVSGETVARGSPVGEASAKEKKDKKKKSWFSNFYDPTYKSRSEDFKRIFKDVPPDERLIVGM